MRKKFITITCFFISLIFTPTLTYSSSNERPICTTVNGQIGWLVKFIYNGQERFIEDPNCSIKESECRWKGTRSEGWYSVYTKPMHERHNNSAIKCDSDEGRNILNSPRAEDYRCIDGVVHKVIRDLIAYDLCSGRRRE